MVTTARKWARHRDVAELEAKLLAAGHRQAPAIRAATTIVRTPRKAAHAMLELRARAELEEGHAVDASDSMRRLADALDDGLTALTRCKVCGVELSDPASVKLGIGPTCKTKPAALKIRPELAEAATS